MIRLALTDLDDTLIPLGAPCVSENSRAAVHRALDAGVRFGPVSGRLPADMSWIFLDDEPCYATGAFANGQIVRVDGRTVREVTIPEGPLEKLRSTLDAAGRPGYLALYDPWVLGRIACVTHEPDDLLAHPPNTFGHSIRRVVRDVRDFPSSDPDSPEPVYVKANVQVTCGLERVVELRDLLREKVPELDFVLPSSKAEVIDVLPLGWDKGCGVRVLMEALGLDASEVAAFGDSENDLAMLAAVENSVAVGNASEQVKAAARWHIGPCDQESVATALNDIAQAYAQGGVPSFMEVPR